MSTQRRFDSQTQSTNGHPSAAREEPHVRDLLKQLANEGGDLVRSEIALAKFEFRDMAREVVLDSARLAAAIALGLTGALVLLAAAVIGLGNLLGNRYGLSALIIGVVVIASSALLARSGIAGLKQVPRPEQTVRTAKNTKDWASRELREFKNEITS